jgi:hypothetical protein
MGGKLMARKYQGTVDRVIVFVTVVQKAAANGVYSSADFDTGGAESFDNAVLCSANGQEPATHLMVTHVVDQQFLDGVLVGVGSAPFLDVYRQSEGYTLESALLAKSLLIVEAP